ncbi:hypothetical protein KIH74_18715 [Kineosporia sp. J2-2]|uniref:WD40 repeat protein n=1 Tax=Kineosporia corallincola TaxID=2835133 RepID=A0ABS5TJG2_9ACTN|nr:hypothetical protein [Kineosporia corallincola]MBT0770978.1 hypothetical protein [Kineosporia corallincola]
MTGPVRLLGRLLLVLFVVFPVLWAAHRPHPFAVLLTAAITWLVSAVLWRALGYLLLALPGLQSVVPFVAAGLLSLTQLSLPGWLVTAELVVGGGCCLVFVVRADPCHPPRTDLAALTRAVARITFPLVALWAAVHLPGTAGVPLRAGLVLGGLWAGVALVLGTIQVIAMPRYASACVVRLDDRPHLVYGGHGHSVWVRDLTTGTDRMRLGTSPAMTPEAVDLAVGAETADAVEMLRDGIPNRFLPGLVHALCPVTTGTGESLLASAGDDQVIYLWNLATGKGVGGLREAPFAIHALCQVPGTPWLAAGGDSAWVTLWDIDTYRPVRLLRTQAFTRALCLLDLDDGLVLAAGGGGGRITLWDPATGTPVERFAGHDGRPVTGLAAITVQGRPALASTGEDGTISVWDPADGSLLHRKRIPGSAVHALCPIRHDGSDLLCVGGDSPYLTLWNPETDETRDFPEGLAMDPGLGWYRALCAAEVDGTTRLMAVGYSPKLITVDAARLAGGYQAG